MLLMSAIDATDAHEELVMARAVSLGYAMARAGKDTKVKSAKRELTRRAYPIARDTKEA